MNTTPQALAEEVSGLFALPDLVVRALAVMDSPASTAQELVEVVELDAGLAATVLRLANSALYGHPRKVETVGHALALIGQKALRDLVLATSAVKTFHDIPAEFVDMDTFWDNSITCGVLAKLIAERARLQESEALFLTGLLHGVGRLVFYAKRPVQYQEVLQKAQADKTRLVSAEREVFGFTYADVGAALLAAWHLPGKFQVIVGHHLAPATAPSFAKEVAALHLASQLTENLAPCLKTRAMPSSYTPSDSAEACMQALGLSTAELDKIQVEALSACIGVIEIMRPGASSIY